MSSRLPAWALSAAEGGALVVGVASVVAAVLLALPGAASAAPADDFRAAIAPVFQADEPLALQRMRAVSPEGLDAGQRGVRECMLARFSAADPAATAPVDPAMPADLAAVLRAYRHYWTEVLMHRRTQAEADAELSRALGTLLPGAPADLDGRSQAAVALAEARGWHALGGVTAPLQEFMLWRSQQMSRERVALPGGDAMVSVSMLDGFASFGWGAWGSCDRGHTGGWATADGLMVVVPGWDLASEHYRVSLLAHESQHFADYPRFPKLASTDLEYRAKLTELAIARDTQRELLESFAASARRERALPHPFAAWWVMAALRGTLGDRDPATWPAEAVRAAAAQALAAHTAALQARGAATVESVLAD